MSQQLKLTGGVYLVVDPSIEMSILLMKLSAALKAGIDAVQIWNNWTDDVEKLSIIQQIGVLCEQYDTPLLINEEWELLGQSKWLSGVHFDKIPDDYQLIKHHIKRPFIAGITCSNNVDTSMWAASHGLDYISFCSMFPSPSAGACEIVMPEVVRQSRMLTAIPIFVSGGITPENALLLRSEIPFDGIAIISGILSAEHPGQKVEQYKKALGLN